MDQAETVKVPASARLTLSECLRQRDELEAKLRHAIEEQKRIRQGLQACLLNNQQAHAQEVTEYRQAAQDRQSKLQDAEMTIGAMGQQLQDAEMTIGAMGQQLQDAEMTIGAMGQQLQDAEMTVGSMKQKLAARESDLNVVGNRITALQEQLDSRVLELKGVYLSLSWRITAPLRWLHRPLVRFKNR